MYSNDRIVELYLEYVNDFLTIDCFAEYHNFDLEHANWIINNGRILNNEV